MRYKRLYAWSLLLRLVHWALVFSIGTLMVTGFYIHFPWTNTYLEGHSTFPMATMRYIHFIAGFVFTGAVFARFYLLVFGNKQERFWDFIPITPKNIANLFHVIRVYLYIPGKHTPRLGHNVLAGTFYFVSFLLCLIQILSGFYMLYPESVFFQKWGLSILGPQQQGRFIHFLFMWYCIIFITAHVYLVVWNDLFSKEGLVSSIFNGTKYFPEKKS